MAPFVPTILWPRVRIPRKKSLLASFFTVKIETVIVIALKKDKNKWKSGLIRPFLKRIKIYWDEIKFVTRLSLTKKSVDHRWQFVSQKWSQKYDKFPMSFTDTYPFCKTTQGNLDVAIAKNLQNSYAILCYRFVTYSLQIFCNGYI